MDISKIPATTDNLEHINVIIEVPRGAAPVKYEIDKDSGALLVDRFMHTSMIYPCNYGFVPNTLSDDGDPADVLVVSDIPLVHSCVIEARPVGVLIMEDESGQDEKIIAVPKSKLYPIYDNVQEYTDLPQLLLDQVSHFFERYKDLEKNKWVKVKGWEGSKSANKILKEAVERYNK